MTETSAELRQEIRVDKLSDRPLLNNKVLIKVDVVPADGFVLSSGLIVAGSKWDDAGHVARYGTVVKAPSRLLYRKDWDFDGAMEWETEVEIQEGDAVFFGKIASANAPAVHVGDDTFYIMNYGDLLLRVRNEEIYPLNGYVILEPVIDKVRKRGLILDFGDHQNKMLGVVKYVGRKNDGYYASEAEDADVNVGDTVIFEGNFYTEIENDVFATLPKGLGYCQACWIIGVL